MEWTPAKETGDGSVWKKGWKWDKRHKERGKRGAQMERERFFRERKWDNGVGRTDARGDVAKIEISYTKNLKFGEN